ncbi:E3 ubiquitin-protein ligase TRIM39-like [Erpetoichthys calabaricus]|uniref:E3 ubiquitin-protein ligase TRIM39-like n=1 Tax=Erpetoichthys calabaricus TaxID=27687 RepID=UPI00223461D8|nr:E3 ubiquitin-protein ligase TRIM39-like [Erpetoichthys calabaricus]
MDPWQITAIVFICAFVVSILLHFFLLCRKLRINQESKPLINSSERQPLIESSDDTENHTDTDYLSVKCSYLKEDDKCTNTKCLKIKQESIKIVNEVEEKGIVLDSVWESYLENEADIILPKAQHLEISESADSLHVRLPQNIQGQDNWPCITGTALSPERSHYWEVEVGEKSSWAIGVASGSKKESICIPDTPEGGFWIIQLCKGKSLEAVSSKVIKLQKEKPRKVGVYLNRNYLSFYNAENKQRIQRFEIKQYEKLYPVFSPGLHDRGPLIIKKKKSITQS